MKNLKRLAILMCLALPSLSKAQDYSGVKYGPETRQFLDIYIAPSNCSTPVYIWSHGNGESTEDINTYIIDTLTAMGISVISWESLTAVFDSAGLVTAWDDANLMYTWLKANASTYNIDTTNLIIGGASRGTVVSWKIAHSADPNIRGLYLKNAVPEGAWSLPTVWTPLDDITVNSPPIFMAYQFPDTINGGHSPQYGMRVQAVYDSLGIGHRDSLVHSIWSSADRNVYQYLPDFALSIIDACSTVGVDAAQSDFEQIDVYPNPFSEQFNISGLSGNEQFTVLDGVGQILMYRVKYDQIDVRSLNAGIYFLSIETEYYKKNIRLIKK